MSLLSLTREIAIDLGTANTIIITDGKIAVEEPSVVAIRKSDDKMKAVGRKAAAMIDRGEERIYTVRPLKKGVIADYKACEMMIRGLIDLIPQRKRLFKPSIRMVVCVPSGATDAEMRIINDSCVHAGAKELYLIYEPQAAALGMGFDVEGPDGCMVVDIGGGTTEIAVISLGGIVQQNSIRIAGDVFTSDIQNYLRQQHVIKVGETTAEKIKIAVGAVIPNLVEEEPEPFVVRGPNLMTGHPVEALIPYQEIAHCLDKSIARLEASIQQVLEQTPPELYSDIVENGIFLSGGGALLRGLDKRLSEKVNIPFHVAEDPLRAVARGTCIALKNTDNYSFLMR